MQYFLLKITDMGKIKQALTEWTEWLKNIYTKAQLHLCNSYVQLPLR